jgi:hypothetical protein
VKQLLRYIVPAALFGLLVWIYIAQEQKSIRTHEKHLKRIVALQNENEDLKKRSDSLLDLSITLDVQMDELEGKADSLASVAESKDLPCERELELRKGEVEYVRAALEKCKESKAIQTTRVGLSEIRVENQVELCGEMMVVNKKDFKQEKRKSFFKGMGTGGLLVGILIILAL